MKLKNSLYIDYLTGMRNVFGFIEVDLKQVFSDNGVVLIIDIVNFKKFNEDYGRVNGDKCLKELSKAIENVLEHENEKKVSAFRTDGDEFTIVIPSKTASEVEGICNSIKAEFNKIMDNYDFYKVGLHTLIMSYDSHISSIEDYYKLLLTNSINNKDSIGDKFQADRLLIHIMGGVISKVRDTISHYNNVYELALTDDISGLRNHRAGSAYLLNLLEDCQSKKTEFSILFIDGDRLKRYNEISYEAGNQMIRKLSEIITNSIRKSDKVYRWLSGDEFIVVLRDVNPDNAVKLAERIRKAVEEQTKDLVYPLTISIGVSTYPNDGNNIDDIINKAEKANALAKNLGKNRVLKWNY
ncbi:MAG: diguanylate cyclase [Tissierella sp.]|nr:diguanylate cyclase [Tissierella sp.]